MRPRAWVTEASLARSDVAFACGQKSTREIACHQRHNDPMVPLVGVPLISTAAAIFDQRGCAEGDDGLERGQNDK